MPIDPIFWLIAAIGFLVLEGMTFSMVSIWFAAGSAAALLSCLFWPSFRVQAVVFIVVSILCLAAAGRQAAPEAHPHQRRPQPWPRGKGPDPGLRWEDRPCPAGRRGLERPLRHPRRRTGAGPDLPCDRDPQYPAHRGACPDRIIHPLKKGAFLCPSCCL